MTILNQNMKKKKDFYKDIADIEAKYQYLIKKLEKVGLDHFNDPKVFMEYSNDMQDVYKNIEDYNPDKKEKY